jgi:hypothetical protein
VIARRPRPIYVSPSSRECEEMAARGFETHERTLAQLLDLRLLVASTGAAA